jgi:hypothetical protein
MAKAASYRSNRGFVITQSNIKRFFDVQEGKYPAPELRSGQPEPCLRAGARFLWEGTAQ